MLEPNEDPMHSIRFLLWIPVCIIFYAVIAFAMFAYFHYRRPQPLPPITSKQVHIIRPDSKCLKCHLETAR